MFGVSMRRYGGGVRVLGDHAGPEHLAGHDRLVLLEDLDDSFGRLGVLVAEGAGGALHDLVDRGLGVVVADVDERRRLGGGRVDDVGVPLLLLRGRLVELDDARDGQRGRRGIVAQRRTAATTSSAAATITTT